MTHSDDARILAYAANRAKAHPHYLGWMLARYSTLENIAEPDLAQILGITSHDLARLSLCLRPRADCFAEDVEHISATFNLDAGRLAQIVRFVESVEAMADSDTSTVSAESGLLMAARSRRQNRQRQDKEGPHDAASQS
jgi:hypothetical protein